MMGTAVVGTWIKFLYGPLLFLMLLLEATVKVWAYTHSLTRRGIISKTRVVSSLVVGGTIVNRLPGAANALEERNEALCATGFFTNIAQYKCTEIGDISGDGKAKQLSIDEEASANSLMGKLGLAQNTSFSAQRKINEGNVSTMGSQSDNYPRNTSPGSI